MMREIYIEDIKINDLLLIEESWEDNIRLTFRIEFPLAGNEKLTSVLHENIKTFISLQKYSYLQVNDLQVDEEENSCTLQRFYMGYATSCSERLYQEDNKKVAADLYVKQISAEDFSNRNDNAIA